MVVLASVPLLRVYYRGVLSVVYRQAGMVAWLSSCGIAWQASAPPRHMILTHAPYTNDCIVPILSVNRVTQLLLYYLIRLPLLSRCARHATPPPTTPRGEAYPADYRHKRLSPSSIDYVNVAGSSQLKNMYQKSESDICRVILFHEVISENAIFSPLSFKVAIGTDNYAFFYFGL